MKKTKRIGMFFVYILIALAVLFVSVGLAELVRFLLTSGVFHRAFSAEEVDTIAGMAEGVIGAIAAGLVLYQLRIGDELDERQSNTEEAEFILEYNRSFIENPDMTAIEQYLECPLTGDAPKFIENLSQNRQILVNYLTYLEGLASCVHGGILELERIDDLFAYRFFLAMNHPEVQSLELLPFATYYRGSFRLYEKWLSYRAATGKYNRKDLDIPYFETALFYCDCYETYARDDLRIETAQQQAIAWVGGKKQLTLNWQKAEDGKITADFSGNTEGDFTVKYALLKALLRMTNAAQIVSANGETGTAYDDLQQARAQCRRDGLYFRQLRKGTRMDDRRLEKLGELIYKTDRYIYPDMFGSEAAALKVIPALIQSEKDPMFSLDNLFVCELAGIPVGMILWCKGALNWSAEPLRKTMQKLGYEIPATLDAVEKEYVSGYSEHQREACISILNVCVDPGMRGCGVGQKMLRAFLQAHPESGMELCVLSDNPGAIRLYESCGFKVCGEEQAYPAGKPDHFRKLMKR